MSLMMWQEQDSALSFRMDAWTLPNSHAYVAITVHYKASRKVITHLLDFIEVAESHTGVALATAFTKVLKAFGITDKVRKRKLTLEIILTLC